MVQGPCWGFSQNAQFFLINKMGEFFINDNWVGVIFILMILLILSMYVEKTSLIKAINHIAKVMNGKKLDYTGQGSMNCCSLAPMNGILVIWTWSILSILSRYDSFIRGNIGIILPIM